MSRLSQIDPKTAEGKTKELLDAVQKKMGKVPNIMKSMAVSPALLGAYLGYSGGLAGVSMSPRLRELVALHVGEINDCGYCLSAHSAVAQALGLDEATRAEARRGHAKDPKDQAFLNLARAMVLERGSVAAAELAEARTAGLTDAEIAELFGVVIQNVYTNWFVHLVEPAIDFPVVKPGIDLEAAH
ncbi:MAG: carboxymuconolactone decarboxylase family protein [Planctomycetes bacterium]|nr:carboxymuconolactone decarboxylase family protein [Planctomycetota bacterium]